MTLNAGTGGDVIAADDVGGAKYQRVKLSLGADGTVGDAPVGGGVESGVLRVTIANDSTGVLSVDDNGGSLTVDASNLSCNVAQINGVTPLMGNGASGTGAHRVTIANDSTGVLATVTTVSTVTNVATIGTSVTPGGSAAHLGKAVDAVAGGSDTGVALLAVRDDSLSTLTPVDGDYTHLRVSSTGALHVTGSAGMTQYTEDGASAGGESLCLVGAVRRDSAASSGGTDGDYVTLNTNATGALRVAADNGVVGAVEDAVASGTAEGILAIAVRDDALTTLTPADGDYTCLRVSSTGALHVTGAGGGTQFAEDAAHTTADVGTVALAVRRDTAAVGSGTDGDYSTLNVNSTGRLYTAANVEQMNGVAVTMGNGASGTGVQRVTVANDSTGILAGVTTVTTLTSITNWGNIVDDAAFTPATTRVLMAGFEADETATDSVDEGDGGAARMTLDRKVIVTPYAHAAAGGCTPYQNLDVDETEDEIKGTAGKLFWIHVMNLHATTVRYLKIYNATAANVTVGSTTPLLTFPVPPTTSGFTIGFGSMGTQFDTAITIAATTGFAVADTGAPGANEIIFNAGYL